MSGYLSCLSLLAMLCITVGCNSTHELSFDAKTLGMKAAPDNFYQVDADGKIYRSGQPDEASFAELEKAGFRCVLNLRRYNTNEDEPLRKSGSIQLLSYGLNPGMMDQSDLVDVLKMMKTAPRPLLIHCMHGADRTGTIVAAYRIVFQNWTPEQAVQEMEHPRYGMHTFFYPNLASLIKRADWKKIKAEVLGK